MPESASDSYQLILEKVPEDKRPDTALFLSGCFSISPAKTKGIAEAAPIALLTDLTRNQAEAVLAEFVPSLPEGVSVAVRTDAEARASRVSHLGWPRPPKIYGIPVEDIAVVKPPDESGEITCPFCGETIRLPGSGIGKSGNTAVIRREPAHPDAPDATDPIFGDIKPLPPGTGKMPAAIRPEDTVWGNIPDEKIVFTPSVAPEREPVYAPSPGASGTGSGSGTGTGTGTGYGRGGTSTTKKSGSRPAAGLAAFMKPGAFAIVVGRTRDNGAVKMIAEIMGIGEGEARERGLSLSLCIARDIALDEAQTLLTRFRNLGAKARIVKPS